MESTGRGNSEGEGLTREAVDGSRAVAAARAAESWVQESSLYRLATGSTDTSGRNPLPDVADGSRLIAAGRVVVSAAASTVDWVGRLTRRSSLYRWLTTEPEPDVIVIDLRETLFVGPVIRTLDRSVAWVVPRWRSSGSRRLSARVSARPVRAFGLVLTTAVATRFATRVVGGGVSTGSGLFFLLLLGIGVLALRSDRSLAVVRDARAYRLLAAILEPPPPPDEEVDSASENGDRTDDSERA